VDHAAAHERIADLALEAGGLERLATSISDADRALRDHLRTCGSCRAELAAARGLRDRLRAAFETIPGAATVEPIAPPDALRAAILDAAHREGAPQAEPAGTPGKGGSLPGGRRFRLVLASRFGFGAPRWAAGLAAALVIALLGGAAGMEVERLSQGPGDDSIAGVVATVDRVLAADQHRIVQLRTPDGTVAGSVAWSQRDFAVLATSLSTPPPGHVYRCWLQWPDQAASVGVMEFAGPTAYWTGSVGEWASVAFDPATRFVVTLEPDAGVAPGKPTTPPVLQADLGT
jgi:hypothetical protein